VPSWNAFSFLFGPLTALIGIGLLVLILRWAFARGGSVVASAGTPGADDAYGLLVPIATPHDMAEGEALGRRLAANGVRANLVSTLDGPRLMVWPVDEARARRLLASDR